MNTQRTFTSFLAAALLLAVTATSSLAMGMGENIKLVPEKQAVFDTIMKDHHAKIDPLTNQLWAKETELNALQGNPKAEPARIEALVKDAVELKTKLAAEHAAVNETLKKELGIQLGQGGMCPMMSGGMKGMMHGGMSGMKDMQHNGMQKHAGMKGMAGMDDSGNQTGTAAPAPAHGGHVKQ